MIVYDYYGDTTQQWNFQALGNGLYRIINQGGNSNGKALCTLENQEPVIVRDTTQGYGDKTQQWSVQDAGNGLYKMINQGGYAVKALSTYRNSNDAANVGNGERIMVYNDYGDASQKWQIVPVKCIQGL